MRQNFEDKFWLEELGLYAIALDGDKRPCRVRTSNAGQLLFTGIVRNDRALKVSRGLLTPQFFSGWGIRTLSSAERRNSYQVAFERGKGIVELVLRGIKSGNAA